MAARKPAPAETAPEETTVDVQTTEASPEPEQTVAQPTEETPDGGETQVAPPEVVDDGAAPDDQEQRDGEDEDEYTSFLDSLSLATAVHVQIDDRYQAFPAGTKIGDVVDGVEFSEELAGTVTNRKAWAVAQVD